MAVADYFQRNAMMASQIAQGLDYEGLIKVVDRHRVGISVDESAGAFEGRAAADLVVRLVARFYPKIAIVGSGPAQEHADELAKLAKAINPKISISRTLSSATHCLAIGDTPVSLKRKNAATIYIGSNNWLARVSLQEPVGSGKSKNPFGTGAAACLGVANLFSIVFAAHLDSDCQPESNINLSLLTLSPKDPKRGRAYGAADVGKVFLAGAGAIGNGVLWALARSGAKGELVVIDPQKVALGNLQRYVMTVRKDDGEVKVELAKGWLAGAGRLVVTPAQKTWDEYAKASDWQFPRVLVALDTAEDRIAVQASLPKWIVNGWTRDSWMGVTRHPTIDDGACLACIYLPHRKAPSLDEMVASALGFQTEPANNTNQELMEIRQRLDRNVPCERGFLERVAAKKNIAIDCLLPFEGRSLRELYTEGVCGGQVLGLVADGRETRAEVPMAFQSVMAGILLAAELVIDCQGLRPAPLPEETRFDMLKPLTQYLSTVSGKDPMGRCLCQDQDFLAAYRDKYKVAAKA